MTEDFEEKHKVLHKFFIDGGFVYLSASGDNYVIPPDLWFDDSQVDKWETLKEVVLKLASKLESFPHYTVAEVAEQLNIPYREVLYLIRMQELGTIKRGGVNEIYAPCVGAYIKRISDKKQTGWLWL